MAKSGVRITEPVGKQDLVDMILQTAIRNRASDIHIDPGDKQFIVRFRVDGELAQWRRFPSSDLAAVISRIKVIANMDITEHRLPQDGRFTIVGKAGDSRDFRVSTSPMIQGEKLVIRVLHKHLFRLEFDYLGYSEHNLTLIKRLVNRPHGLILHCGPTGSGKTTSLYTAINYLNDNTRNIQTIEDPVEGKLPGINQAQVKPEIDLTFASLLRAYLRQDCDVILVGEIRDNETAQLAVQASLTGHLILGTMHAKTASSAVTRLVEMGVSSFFVGSALSGVVNQRLIRRLCIHCRKPYTPSAKVAQRFCLQPGAVLYTAVGCDRCRGKGYRGRICVQEVMAIDSILRDAIVSDMPEFEVQRLAIRRGMINLLSDGLAKAMAGFTTVDEVTLVIQGVGLSVEEMVSMEGQGSSGNRPPTGGPRPTKPPPEPVQSEAIAFVEPSEPEEPEAPPQNDRPKFKFHEPT